MLYQTSRLLLLLASISLNALEANSTCSDSWRAGIPDRPEIEYNLTLGRSGMSALQESISLPDSVITHWATVGDSAAIADWLANGGNPNRPDFNAYSLLSVAAYSHQIAIVRMLLTAQADVNQAGWNGYTPLHHAVGADDTTIIGLLIAAGADLEKRDEADRTPLFLAVDWARLPALKALLSHGADANSIHHYQINESSVRPIHHAAAKGFTEFIRILIEAGADVESKDSNGQTPLMSAWNDETTPGLFCGNTYVTEDMVIWPGKDAFLFLLQRADTSQWQPTRDELLIRGAKYDSPELLERAFVRGADPTERIPMELGSGEMGYKRGSDSILGRQSVHLAAKFNAAKSLAWLIAHGAKANTLDTNGLSPFDYALSGNAADAIKFLISKGIPFDEPDSTYRTPLVRALHDGKFLAAMALVEAGADLSRLDLTDPQPLLNAIYWHSDSMVVPLLKWGFSANEAGEGGKRPIHYAALGGKDEICELLIDAGANPDLKDNEGATPFAHTFADDRYTMRISTIHALLKKGANVNQSWGRGETALKMAVLYQDLGLARTFLEHGANSNFLDANGCTPLAYCRGVQSVEMAKLLFEFGADTTGDLPQDNKTLAAAAQIHEVKLFDFLISKGFKLDVSVGPANTSPLYFAIQSGDTAVARRLIEAGIDPDLVRVHQETFVDDWGVFEMVCINNDSAMLRVLIQGGTRANLNRAILYVDDKADLVKATVELRRKRGETPLVPEKEALHMAAYCNAPKSAALLIDAGADVNYKDRQQQTPLWWAINAPEGGQRSLEPKIEVTKVLLDKGANPDQTDIAGNNLLCFAAANDAGWMVSLLLKAGAPVDSRQSSRTALHYAVFAGSFECTRLLVEAGADIDAVELRGHRPLTIAKTAGNEKIVKYLKKRGANGTQVIPSPAEALITAVKMQDTTVVKELLRIGLPINSITENGVYLLHLAVITGNVSVVKLLMSAGAISGIIESDGKATDYYLRGSRNRDLYMALGMMNYYPTR